MKPAYKIALVAVTALCITLILVSMRDDQDDAGHLVTDAPQPDQTAETPDRPTANRLTLRDDSGSNASSGLNDLVNRYRRAAQESAETQTKPPGQSEASEGPSSEPIVATFADEPISPLPLARDTQEPDGPVSLIGPAAILNNPAEQVGDGEPTEPPPATTIKPNIPARTAVRVAATTYTIKGGDTLSSIAEALYGSERRWVDIAQANPRVDPTKLRVNQVIKLPQQVAADADEADTPAGPGPTVIYVVRGGDTLSEIAATYYKRPTLWRVIYNANRNTIGPNPNRLRAGARLTIPPAPVPAR